MKYESSNSGIEFKDLLTLLFIGLKLTGYINWPLWVVLSPLYLKAIILIVLDIAIWMLERKKNDC